MVSFFYEDYSLRSDFASELITSKKDGYVVINKKYENIKSTKVVIHDKNNALNKDIGTYYSIEFESLDDEKERSKIVDVLTKDLRLLLKESNFKYGDTVLVVGLGNRYVSADSLGPEVATRINVTNHIFELKLDDLPKGTSKVVVLTPGVMGQTGMETSDIIEAVNKKIKANIIIVIDALASMNIRRINKMIQITDTGIHPGSGVGNKRKGINFKNFNTPVIAIGVATVVEASNIIYQVLIQNDIEPSKTMKDYLSQSEYQLVVTPKEIDEEVMHLSNIISLSINKALHYKYEEF